MQPTNFSVTIRQAGPISLLDVSGRLTSFETGALRESISRLLKQDRKNIVLNLSELQYLDSSGIGELVSSFTTVTNGGGQLKLLNLTKKIQELLAITKLLTVFQVFNDEKTAVASF